MDFLSEQPPWFVLGPCIGLLVVGLLAAVNERLGVLGGWADVLDRIESRAGSVSRKGWFFAGVILGGIVFVVVSGTTTAGTGAGYGWLSREFSSPVVVGAILVLAGLLIGYGARMAGGCTSGNGLGGSSFASPAGWASTATFIGTAVGATVLVGAIA
jgi:hypothetical protein